jgi:hypothetical protein
MTSTSFGRSRGHEATGSMLHREREIVLNRLWERFEIHHIIAKTFDMMRHVRTEPGQLGSRHFLSLILALPYFA